MLFSETENHNHACQLPLFLPTGCSTLYILTEFEAFMAVMYLIFDLGFMVCPDYFIHFEPSQSQGGAKTGDPREKNSWPPTSRTWFVSHWPDLVSNPHRWDDLLFRSLEVSVLNHSATGAPRTWWFNSSFIPSTICFISYKSEKFGHLKESLSFSWIMTRQSDLGQYYLSQLMRLWHFPSSINAFFKCACTAIQWG